jgi:hypothetical protein
MKIRLSQHFAERQRLRDISVGLAETILREADGHYHNGISGWNVAVKRIVFQGKDRDIALTYTVDRNEIILITVHPLKEGQKDQRIKSGRWIAYESPSLL